LLEELLSMIRNDPNCAVFPPQGIPVVSPPHILPEDVREFYEYAGGAYLFDKSDYPIQIVGPDEFTLAAPVIAFCEPNPNDISANWYIIARGPSAQYLTIDLSAERLGLCYDSYWDSFANPGDTPIIALSFNELLKKLYLNGGRYWYWLKDDFDKYGDAYDYQRKK
jgi:hypothetical protein